MLEAKNLMSDRFGVQCTADSQHVVSIIQCTADSQHVVSIIQCTADSQHVVSINLASNNLNGSLPDVFLPLTNLTVFNVPALRNARQCMSTLEH